MLTHAHTHGHLIGRDRGHRRRQPPAASRRAATAHTKDEDEERPRCRG